MELIFNLFFEIGAGAIGDDSEDFKEWIISQIEQQGKIERLSRAITAFLESKKELSQRIDAIKKEIINEKSLFDENKKKKVYKLLIMIANDSDYRSIFKKSLETTKAFQNSAIEQQKRIKDFFCVIADICVDMLGSDKEQIKKYCEDFAKKNEECFNEWAKTIMNALEENARKIMENSDKNKEEIMENSDKNKEEIMENSDKNKEEIMEEEKKVQKQIDELQKQIAELQKSGQENGVLTEKIAELEKERENLERKIVELEKELEDSKKELEEFKK